MAFKLEKTYILIGIKGFYELIAFKPKTRLGTFRDFETKKIVLKNVKESNKVLDFNIISSDEKTKVGIQESFSKLFRYSLGFDKLEIPYKNYTDEEKKDLMNVICNGYDSTMFKIYHMDRLFDWFERYSRLIKEIPAVELVTSTKQDDVNYLLFGIRENYTDFEFKDNTLFYKYKEFGSSIAMPVANYEPLGKLDFIDIENVQKLKEQIGILQFKDLYQLTDLYVVKVNPSIEDEISKIENSDTNEISEAEIVEEGK